MGRIEKVARDTPGVAHTVGISGQSLILNANAPNLGSLYIMLQPFAERTDSARSADAIARELERRCSDEIRGAAVRVFGAPPIEGPDNRRLRSWSRTAGTRPGRAAAASDQW